MTTPTPLPCAGGCPAHSHAIDRRQFLSAAALASVTLALTACGDHQIGGVVAPGDPTLGTGTAGLTIRVADFAALGAVGGVARVTQTGAPVAVYRSAASTYLAFAMRCPHSGTTVNITASGFTCPNHNARFAKDGTWLGGKATTSLVSIPATFDPATGILTLASSGHATPPDEEEDDDLRAVP